MHEIAQLKVLVGTQQGCLANGMPAQVGISSAAYHSHCTTKYSPVQLSDTTTIPLA